MSKRVEDSATVLSVIAGHDEHDATSSDKEVPDYRANLNKDMSGVTSWLTMQRPRSRPVRSWWGASR